ncbi:GPN-loop GTPase 2 [Bacillus rossius redtenbacheri]|uniref:GPN-loop GTPase 2 n=1 Tax=Bacillus rossius redtenbacheri TaxID=93214 RepID=UPI002FDD226E
MAAVFGQLVVGPPGSGKTSYCRAMGELLRRLGRKVAIVNIDPANDDLVYEAAADISQLVRLEEVMQGLRLGPNGGLVYCMEFLEENVDWLLQQVAQRRDHYFLFDCPGQVELYTHHNSVKNVMEKLSSWGLQLCTVHLVDAHYCNDPGKFVSTLLLSLSAMLQIELPHVNVLSKVDLVSQFGDKLQFGLDFYTEVLDLGYLLEALDDDPRTSRFKKLNVALVSLVEDYSLVSFHPLSVRDTDSLLALRSAVDRANGYIYGCGEERNIHALLSCAVGAQYEVDRSGKVRDMAEDYDSRGDNDGDGELLTHNGR